MFSSRLKFVIAVILILALSTWLVIVGRISTKYIPLKVSEPEANTQKVAYIINRNTKKVHRPNCIFIYKSQSDDIAGTNASRYQLEDIGYSPCGYCDPW